uniref:Laminin G domain-containing protein n=1 Tax=Anser brachyrhynchus TaxID=132585 RepID=A0A8B9D0J4_9AVES
MTSRHPWRHAPPSLGCRHGTRRQTGWVHRSPELCAWTWGWKIHIPVLYEVCLNQALRRHLEFGSTFVGFQGEERLIYVGHKRSVYFDYNVHDGQWHNMAIDIRGQTVTLFTSCGKHRVHADLHFKKDEALDPHGSFLFGKINQHSVQFEGAICQFDIYPSAKAAHHYCKYLKKQCRQADTYRPNLPPLIPILPRDPSASPSTPQHMEPSLQGLKNLTTATPSLAFALVLREGRCPLKVGR